MFKQMCGKEFVQRLNATALLQLSRALLVSSVVILHTAQAFAQSSQPSQFSNITKAAGINFTHLKGNNGISTILEEAGPGVCVSDYDGDGYLDIYFVNGRDAYQRGITARNALYRNNGDGTFTDVTERASVPGNAYGLGCVWGDYDNDGNPDLYVAQYGKNIFYRNNGDGTFTDVTDKTGTAGLNFQAPFHTGATFFDYDRDGYLDLYVGSYVSFGEGSRRTCPIGKGILTSCPPSAYPGTAATLYHNNGNGTFTDVTRRAGIYQPNGKNLSVLAADYDNDGWTDLFVANDGVEAYLYHNNRDGTFRNVAMTSGVALTADGATMAAMCLSLGDYDNDGWLDLYISDFQAVPDRLFRNDGKAFFEEVSEAAKIAETTTDVLSFGGGFFDYDNDGWLDIFIANGHVYPEVEQAIPGVHYKQINSLFHNEGGGKFTNVTRNAGDGFSTPAAGRGAAFADFDNDGNLDVVVANNGDAPALLHNSGQAGNHFLNFKLVGVKSNRDAMGARVTVHTVAGTRISEISAGGSYLSQSDVRAHFGLGKALAAESVEVWWPSGERQLFRQVSADKFYLIVEGRPRLEEQKFGRTRSGQAAGPTRLPARS